MCVCVCVCVCGTTTLNSFCSISLPSTPRTPGRSPVRQWVIFYSFKIWQQLSVTPTHLSLTSTSAQSLKKAEEKEQTKQSTTQTKQKKAKKERKKAF